MAQLKERLSMLMKFLQEESEEDQRCSWKPRKRIKWTIVQLFARKPRQKLRQMMHVWLQTKDRLKEAEYKMSFEARQIVQIFEPKQGMILGEDDEDGEDEVQNEYLMRCLERPVQKKEVDAKSINIDSRVP